MMSKSNQQSPAPKERFLERLYSSQRKYNERLESRKYLSFQEELKRMKSRPEINRNAGKLVNKKPEGYKPLHDPDRLTREMDMRKEKRRIMKEKLEKQR